MNFVRDRLVEKLKKHDEKALSKIIEQQSGFVASVIYNTSKGNLEKEDIEEVIADVYSPTEEPAIDLASNRIIIDIDKIQSVIINGDTIYQK